MFNNGSVYNNSVYSSQTNTSAYSGTFYVGNLTAGGTFTLTCNDPGGSPHSSNMTVNVTSQAATLTPPILTAQTGRSCGGFIDLSWNQVSGVSIYQLFRGGSLL